jgi:exonuclease SbcC
LKIQGLNSFEEEQVIDFEKLTAGGLFGIFGPTGSGKSTIIDAITLALYDKISRYDGDKQTRQFMNANVKTLAVCFCFELGGAVYTAERSYERLRKSKTAADEALQPVASRLYEKRPDGIEVLADKSKKMTEEAARLIGISYYDFTRSVILPQGKFSEFLLLANRDRRDMLERIFRLERYGDSLNKKISGKANEVKTQLAVAENSLNLLGDVTKDRLQEETEKLDKAVLELSRLKQTQETDRQEWIRLKSLREIYDEYLRFLRLRVQYRNGDPARTEKSSCLQKAKRADWVKPLMDEAARVQTKAERIQSQWEAENRRLAGAAAFEEQTRIAHEDASAQKDERYPQLLKREADLHQAIRVTGALRLMEEERETLLKGFAVLKEQEGKLRAEHKEGEASRKHLRAEREKLEARKQEIQVSQEFRQKIGEGYDLLRSWEEVRKRTARRKTEMEQAAAKVGGAVSDYETAASELQKASEAYEALSRQGPVGAAGAPEWLEQNQNWLQAESDLNRNLENDELLTAARRQKAEGEKEREKCRAVLSEAARRQKEAETLYASAEASLEHIRHTNAVLILAEGLTENEPCPVCGSLLHPHPAISSGQSSVGQSERLSDHSLQDAIQSRDSAAPRLEAARAAYQQAMIAFQTVERRLEPLEAEITVRTARLGAFEPEREKQALAEWKQKLNTLEKNIKIFEASQKKLEKKLQDWRVQTAAARERMESCQNRRLETGSDWEKVEEECAGIKTQLEAFAQDFSLPNFTPLHFKTWREKILAFDKEREELDKQENALRLQWEKWEQTLTELQSRAAEMEKQLSVILAQGQEKKQMIDQQKEALSRLMEAPGMIVPAAPADPQKALQALQKETKNLLSAFDEAAAKSAAAAEEKQKLATLVAGLQKQRETMLELLETQMARLNSAMRENSFASQEELLSSLMEPAARIKLEKELEAELDAFKKAEDNIVRLQEKIKAMQAIDEDLSGLREKEAILETRIAQQNADIENLTRQNAVSQERTAQMARDLERANVLRAERKTLTEQNDLLSDLTELLKGNRFVEFIARRQLKYITAEASIRLKEMTAGRFALELDGTDFIIRDDYNGGVRRSPKTLSGGETFMTSLCLALALSSKIQLKSRAPLDFFFLDEGFGTLDQAALDAVMNSLEKLRREKMKIGVITHVEELKSRLSAKLIVTPQEQGLHGTLVRIEM